MRLSSTGKVVVFDPWAHISDRYRAHLRSSGASESTIHLRLYHLRRIALLAPRPRDITLSDLEAIVGRPGLKPESRKSLRASARRFFTWAVKAGFVDEDPSAALPGVRVPMGAPRPAPETVVAQAVLAARPRERAMLMLAAYQGLRAGEIAVLHARDIAGDTLRVQGKGGKVRFVPLNPVVAENLPFEDGYLFPGKIDGHLSARWVYELMANCLPDGWTAHTLRHRFATAAYAAERDLLAVQALLGHASITTTVRYTRMPDDALTRAVLAAGPVKVA